MEQIRRSLAAVATDAAEKAAKATVERLFATAGIDITDEKGIVRFQRVVGFGGDMLDARDTIRKTSLRTAVGLFVTGAFTIMVLGFKDWFHH